MDQAPVGKMWFALSREHGVFIHPRRLECWGRRYRDSCCKVKLSKQMTRITGYFWISLPAWREQANNSMAQHMLPQDRAALLCVGWQHDRAQTHTCSQGVAHKSKVFFQRGRARAGLKLHLQSSGISAFHCGTVQPHCSSSAPYMCV